MYYCRSMSCNINCKPLRNVLFSFAASIILLAPVSAQIDPYDGSSSFMDISRASQLGHNVQKTVGIGLRWLAISRYRQNTANGPWTATDSQKFSYPNTFTDQQNLIDAYADSGGTWMSSSKLLFY